MNNYDDIVAAINKAVRANVIRKTASWIQTEAGKRWEAEKVTASAAANEELVELLTGRREEITAILAASYKADLGAAETVITLDGSGKLIDRLITYTDGGQHHWTSRRILLDPENAAEPLSYADVADVMCSAPALDAAGGITTSGGDLAPAEYLRSDCGCGYELIFTEEGWQHDAAPYLWGDDHDPDPDDEAVKLARRWEVERCEHRPDDLPEPGDRCKDCGVDLTWTGPGMGDYAPAFGWENKDEILKGES